MSTEVVVKKSNNRLLGLTCSKITGIVYWVSLVVVFSFIFINNSKFEQSSLSSMMMFSGIGLLTFSLFIRIAIRWLIKKPILRALKAIGDISEAENYDELFQKNEFSSIRSVILGSLEKLSKTDNSDYVKVDDRIGLDIFREKELTDLSFYNVGDAVITTDTSNKIAYFNNYAESITGFSAKEAIGQDVNTIITLCESKNSRSSGASLTDHIRLRYATKKIISGMTRKNENRMEVSFTVTPLKDEGGASIGSIIIIQDNSASRRNARSLSFTASHDELTGLFNKYEFEAYVYASIHDAKCTGSEHALMILDIEQFKLVNDIGGHAAGDSLLVDVANSLHYIIRDTDIIARLSGDKIGLLLPFCPVTKIKEKANHIIEHLNRAAFKWTSYDFDLIVNVGACVINNESQTTTESILAALHANKTCKTRTNTAVHIYNGESRDLQSIKTDREWASKINSALARGKFELYAQAINPIKSSDNDPLYCEVLIRLIDDDGKVLLPGEFLGAAEKYFLLPHIDRWVIKNTVIFLSNRIKHLKDGMDIKISINLSCQSLTDHSMFNYIKSQLLKYRVPGSCIGFEISERAVVEDSDKAVTLLKDIQSLGCFISLDDFGNGLSSMLFLKKMDIDYIKIDGSFVSDIHESEDSLKLIKAINNIGTTLGIETVAEYVENEDIYKLLSEIGVNFGQGFYLDKPQPIEDYFTGKTD